MIATTKEQSRRLSTAGVSTNSADMVYGLVMFGDTQVETILPRNEEIEKNSIRCPAWSLSALWDILHRLDKTYEFDTKMDSAELVEHLVSVICYRFENR